MSKQFKINTFFTSIRHAGTLQIPTIYLFKKEDRQVIFSYTSFIFHYIN